MEREKEWHVWIGYGQCHINRGPYFLQGRWKERGSLRLILEFFFLFFFFLIRVKTVCFAKKFYLKKKSYFSLNQTDLGPVSARIRPNWKKKMVTNTRAAISTNAWRVCACWTRVQLRQWLHDTSMHVGRACSHINNCTARPCVSNVHVLPLEAHPCFPI